MKKALMIGLTLVSFSALAAKENLDVNNLKDVVDSGVQEKVRVYLDQPMAIVYKINTDFTKSLDNGDIKNTTVDNFRVNEIDAKTKGKIIDIKNNENDEMGDVYVSFDNECSDINCSYKFTFNGARYVLSDVPDISGLEYVKVESGIFKWGNAYKEVHLKINITNIHMNNRGDIRKASGVK